MKKTLVSITLLGATLTMAQVGINTEEPKATLDVVASPADMTLTDGFIAPRLTGDEMKAKDGLYTDVTGQTGAIVYATTASSDAGVTGTKTINVDGAGYYYFDGTVWVKFGSGVAAPVTNDWHITGNTDIVAGTNFLGTTSANKVALEFKVNGERAGYIGDDNTNTVGAQGLYKTTLGYQAGMGTTGDRVTAIGNHALSLNTAQNNTAIGAFALQNNVTGQNNMAVGDHALRDNTSRRNSAIGSNALNSNTTGEGNTAIGYRANASNVAGSFNTFIGSQAGEGVLATGAVTDANSSIAIGRGTTMGAGLTNAMVIGAYGSVTQSNSMVLGALPGTYAGVTVGATKVGIGVTAPTNTLHVVATADPLKLEGLQTGTATDEVLVVNNNVVKKVTAASLASSLEPWQNQSDATKATSNTAAIYQTGNVSIGSQTPIAPFTSNGSTITPKLSVTGDVASTGSFYTNTGKYADYVFEDYFDGSSTINEDYKFMSLDETAAYIKENKHLPGVTSINDILKTENGYTVNLSELSIQQLEKIEELYLHTIEQQQEIENQKKEINDLKSRFAELEALLLKENNNK